MTENQLIERTVTTPTTNKLAVISLVMALMGFLIPIIPQIGGIICGHIARSKIRQSGGAQTGSEIALAGLTVSYLNIVIFCIFHGFLSFRIVGTFMPIKGFHLSVTTHSKSTKLILKKN